MYIPHPRRLRLNPGVRSRYELPALVNQAQMDELHTAVAEAEGAARETAPRFVADDKTA